MTTKQKLIAQLEATIRSAQEKLQQLESLGDRLDKISVDAQVYDGMIDFNSLTHDQIIEVIKAVGGKWDKSISSHSGTRIHYQTQVEGVTLRCWNGEPPPNCKIVDEVVTIPAQPERVETRRKLVCL